MITVNQVIVMSLEQVWDAFCNAAVEWIALDRILNAFDTSRKGIAPPVLPDTVTKGQWLEYKAALAEYNSTIEGFEDDIAKTWQKRRDKQMEIYSLSQRGPANVYVRVSSKWLFRYDTRSRLCEYKAVE